MSSKDCAVANLEYVALLARSAYNIWHAVLEGSGKPQNYLRRTLACSTDILTDKLAPEVREVALSRTLRLLSNSNMHASDDSLVP